MTAVFLAAIVVAECAAQVGVLGLDAAGADKSFEDLKQEGDFGPIERKPTVRPSLLSADQRWAPGRKSEFAGPLAAKKPSAFKVGDWGCVTCTFRFLSKVGEFECLAVPKLRNADPVLLKGFDLSDVAEGTEFVLRHPVVIQETHDITEDGGGKRSVLVLNRDRFDSFYAEMKKPETAPSAAPGAAVAGDATSPRAWTDAKGKPLEAQARFIEFKDNRVHLQRTEDGAAVEIAMTELSRADREWVRDELKRRRSRN
ncbi:MAG: hypothetical protein KF861_05205 [Planctomycetaceae bacterium]|nr:hypothetical protein [Planctomycetaceae bacterium]